MIWELYHRLQVEINVTRNISYSKVSKNRILFDEGLHRYQVQQLYLSDFHINIPLTSLTAVAKATVVKREDIVASDAYLIEELEDFEDTTTLPPSIDESS